MNIPLLVALGLGPPLLTAISFRWIYRLVERGCAFDRRRSNAFFIGWGMGFSMALLYILAALIAADYIY